ncbi:carbonic anhydrase-like [Ptychodera flava]|uniref:carbonic anhydrase-like n=1 Tax=Ptychodera flava TaxID=63121 RepID=UPI003969E640
MLNMQAWSYSGETGPQHWGRIIPQCASTSQSPIDIVGRDAVPVELGDLSFVGCSERELLDSGHNAKLVNDGHSIQVRHDGANCVISGGSLPGGYKVDHFHLHWGSDSSKGSEHTLDGKELSAELHIVMHSTEYENQRSAVGKVNGTVIGILIEVGQTSNPAYDKFLDYHKDVLYRGDVTNLDHPVPIIDLFPTDKSSYYRYMGSVTSPPCFENVIWTVLKEPVQLSETQMEKFRILYMSEAGASPLVRMVDNYRPPQPLNSRTVYRNCGNETDSAKTTVKLF